MNGREFQIANYIKNPRFVTELDISNAIIQIEKVFNNKDSSHIDIYNQLTKGCGVYILTFKGTGRYYVGKTGSTQSFKKRWAAHYNKLKRGTYKNILMCHHFQKNEGQLLCYIYAYSNQKDKNDSEIEYIEKVLINSIPKNALYNKREY